MLEIMSHQYKKPDFNPYNEFTPLQFFNFYDKYSRFDWNTGKRETWDEAIGRTTNLLRYLSNNQLTNEEYQAIYEKLYKMEIQPSMRLMATSLEQLERDNISQYNCCYIVIDSIESMVESLYIGMSGVGMGYSVEKKFINQLPIVSPKTNNILDTYIVPDTTEGWCNSVRILLTALYNGDDINFDYSKVRPAGMPLKIKGGYSSGSQILQDVHMRIKKIFSQASGRKFIPIEAHDLITTLADAGLSGGIRRSALLCLFDEDEEDMLRCKSGNYYITNPNRMNSNNSIVLSDRYYSQEEIDELLNEMWESGTGEPGLYNRGNVLRTVPSRRKLSESDKSSIGTNACQPGFATVLTPDGIRTFNDIKIGDIIWSGKQWTKVVNKQFTGIKNVNVYSTSGGEFIGTENHRIVQNGSKVEVKDATQIDVSVYDVNDTYTNWQDVMDGMVIGDGMVHKASNNKVLLVIGDKDYDYFGYKTISDFIIKARPGISNKAYEVKTTITSDELPRTFNRFIPDRFFFGDKDKAASFLKGLFTANGCVNGYGTRVELKQTSLKLIRQVQQMLSSLGIRSYITTSKEKPVQHQNGTYISKQAYNLTITTDRYKFAKLIGFVQDYKMDSIKGNTSDRKNTYDITQIESLGEMPVYDITVDADEHTYWTSGLLVSNCSEIILRNHGVCNLSSAIIRKDDTIDIMLDKIKWATIVGDIQSMGTNFPNLRKSWENTAKEDRLLGVNILGYAENKLLQDESVLELLKNAAIQTDLDFAERFNLKQSVAITSAKPSGNTSVLYNTTPGINPYHFQYCYRNVTVQIGTTMYNYLYANGVPFQEYLGKPGAVMFKFPFKAPDNADVIANTPAIQQLENWKKVKLNYTEHNPSITITYRPEEIEDCKKWLHDNQNIICGISLFPAYDASHPMLPIQEITKDEYDNAIANFPDLNWENFYMYEQYFDQRNIALECAGGRCDI